MKKELSDEIQNAKNIVPRRQQEEPQPAPDPIQERSLGNMTDLDSPQYRALLDRIVQWRADSGLTQAQIAADIGIAQPCISNAERGKTYCPRLLIYYLLAGGDKK